MKQTIQHLTFLLLICILTQVSQGAVLATYNFAGGSAADSAGAANLTVSTFTVSGTAIGGISGANSEAFMRSTGIDSTLVNAISGTDYFEFSISVDAGYQMDLSSLVFDHRASVNSAAFPYTSHLSSFTSIDGFTAADALGTSTATQSTNTSGSSVFLRTETVTFSGGSYQNLTGTTTFRIYGFDDQHDTNNILRLDNLVVNGTVSPIPESTSSALLALGALGLLTRRQK